MSIKIILAHGQAQGGGQFLGTQFVKNLLSAQLLLTTDGNPRAVEKLLTEDDICGTEQHLRSVPALIEALFEARLTLALATALQQQNEQAADSHLAKAWQYLDTPRYSPLQSPGIYKALHTAGHAQVQRICNNWQTASDLFDQAEREFLQIGRSRQAAICRLLGTALLLRQGMTQKIPSLSGLAQSLKAVADQLDAQPHDTPPVYALRPWALAARVWLATAYGQQGQKKQATQNLARAKQLSESCQYIGGEWPYLAYEDMNPHHELAGTGLTVYRPMPLLCGWDPAIG